MFICTTHLQSKIISESSINRGAESVFRQRSQINVCRSWWRAVWARRRRTSWIRCGKASTTGWGRRRITRPTDDSWSLQVESDVSLTLTTSIESNVSKDHKTGANQSSFLLPDQTGNGFPTFFKIQNFWKRNYKNETVKKQRKQIKIASSHRDSWK